MIDKKGALKAFSDKEMADLKNLLTELENIAATIGMDMSPKERKSLPRFGTRSLTFAEDALLFGQQHPELLPPSLDMKKFSEFFQLYRQTQQLLIPLKVLLNHFIDTHMASGAYIYEAARAVYDAAKAGAKLKKPSAKEGVKKLGLHFKKNKTKSNKKQWFSTYPLDIEK
jgi:hypothetical protein